MALSQPNSCRLQYQLSRKPVAKGLTARRSTTPWFALVSEREVKTRAKGIQGARWFVNSMGSSSSRVLYRGEADVLLQENMASTQGSVT